MGEEWDLEATKAKAFGVAKKRRGQVARIWWCKQHRAEKSYSDERGLTLCWKAEGLNVMDKKPCRMVEMQLAPDDVLVIVDMPSFLNVLEDLDRITDALFADDEGHDLA